jgi:anti-sigma regulatory factor (Ser/Thr protein kinase)
MIPLLHTSPAQARPIKYIMSELVRNVLEHANSPIGAIVCAQYFKKTNRVSIGVVDLGVGIKKTIEVSHIVHNDLSAIKLALSPGITGLTAKPGGTEDNAGAGLFFIKSIAVMNRDFFMIYSGNSMYKLLKRPNRKIVKLYSNPFRDRHSKQEDLPFWQGTVVGIDISLSGSKNFEKILKAIRDVWHLEIKESKKETRFKKARFL